MPSRRPTLFVKDRSTAMRKASYAESIHEGWLLQSQSTFPNIRSRLLDGPESRLARLTAGLL